MWKYENRSNIYWSTVRTFMIVNSTPKYINFHCGTLFQNAVTKCFREKIRGKLKNLWKSLNAQSDRDLKSLEVKSCSLKTSLSRIRSPSGRRGSVGGNRITMRRCDVLSSWITKVSQQKCVLLLEDDLTRQWFGSGGWWLWGAQCVLILLGILALSTLDLYLALFLLWASSI